MARFVIFFVLLSILAIIASLVSMIFRQIGKWNHIVRQIGERYGGTMKPGGPFGNPGLQFPYGEHYCHLKFRRARLSKSRGRLTEFATHWPDRRFQFRLVSNNFPFESRPNKRQVAMTVSESEFNDKFNMWCLPLHSGQKIVSDGVQWHVEQLAQHCGDGALSIVISGGLLTISKPNYIRNQTELDDFVRFSLALLDQLNLTRSEGIEFETEDSAKLLETVYCPICSEEILDQMVVCVRCKTPHCQDCWEYNGQCATFACGEERFLSSSAETNLNH